MVTISGTGFSGADAVTFGPTSAQSFTVNSATSITATAPRGSGTVDVTVTTSGGTSATTSADHFTYTTTTPTPIVAGISPTSGPATGGTVVTVSGSGLSAASAVHFGAALATNVTVVTDGQLSVDAPAGIGTVNVTVTTPGGTSAATSADDFTYQAQTGCTDVWTGASSNDWGTAANWSTGAVPGTSDDVCIPSGVADLPVVLSSTATISESHQQWGSRRRRDP